MSSYQSEQHNRTRTDYASLTILVAIIVALSQMVFPGQLLAQEDSGDQRRRESREQEEAEAKWSNAESSYMMKDFDTARRLYNELREDFSETTYGIRAFMRLGDVYREQNEYQQALDFYQRMTDAYSDLSEDKQDELEEDYIRTRYQIGATHYDRENYRRVFSEMRRFVREFPESEYANTAYFLIGEAHLENESYRSAIEAFDMVGTARGSRDSDQLSSVSPGDMFYVQIQDPDLKSGGGERIVQVRATTESGDTESVFLQQRGVDSDLFVGQIQTRLGPARPTATLEDEYWSPAIDQQVTRLLRQAQEHEQRAEQLRDRRKKLEERKEEVSADDSLGGQEQVDMISDIDDRISDADEKALSNKRSSRERKKEAYKLIDRAFRGIEEWLAENAPEHAIDSFEEDVEEKKEEEEEKEQEEEEQTDGAEEQSDIQGMEGEEEEEEESDVGDVYSKEEILEVRKEAQDQDTNEDNFEDRRSRLQYWFERLMEEIKRLDLKGNDTITVLYEDEQTSSGEGPVARKKQVAVASDADVAFTGEEFQSEVQQGIYGAPVHLKVRDPDRSVSDEKDTVEVALSVVEAPDEDDEEGEEGEEREEREEGEEGEDQGEEASGQIQRGHGQYKDSYAPDEEYEIKETESEDGETKRELVKTDGEDKPELIPEGAPSTTIELEETSPHSGEFTAVLEGTPRGVQAGDTKMNVPPDRLLRAAYEDETNISRRETWVVSSAMNIVPGSEGDIESPRTEDSSMSRRAQLDKGISLGELAKIYEDLGLEQMASDYYERALRTCGEVAQQEGLTSLGQEATHAIWELYFESGQPEKVIRACEQLVDEFPDSELVDEAYMTMGKALMTRAEEAEDRERNNYLRRAASALRRLLKARPESEHKAEALYTLGKVLFEAGEGGSDYMEQVVDEHPDSSYAALALKESGEHAYDNKDYSSAYEYFQRIIRNYPDAEGIARVRFLSGHCQVRQRNFAEALDSYHDLINNHPGSKYAQQAEKIIEQIRKQMD